MKAVTVGPQETACQDKGSVGGNSPANPHLFSFIFCLLLRQKL